MAALVCCICGKLLSSLPKFDPTNFVVLFQLLKPCLALVLPSAGAEIRGDTEAAEDAENSIGRMLRSYVGGRKWRTLRHGGLNDGRPWGRKRGTSRPGMLGQLGFAGLLQ